MASAARKKPASVVSPTLPPEEVSAVHSELRALAKGHDIESVDIDEAVAAAKDPKSAMHKYVTWDVQEAAQERWRDQIRSLIRTVRYLVVTHSGLEAKVRAYVNVKESNRDNKEKVVNVYVPRELIFKKKNYRDQVVSRALGQLRTWCLQHVDIKELDTVRAGVAKLIGLEL